MIFLLLLAGVSAAADCQGDDFFISHLSESMNNAVSLFVEGDERGFVAEARTTEHIFLCLRQPMGPHEVRDYHMLRALVVWDESDPSAARPYLLAAKGIEADSRYVADVLAHREDIATVWRGLESNGGPVSCLPPSAAGWLEVDGLRAREVPLDRAYVLQRVGANSVVLESSYQLPWSPAPQYPRIRPRLVAVAVPSALASGLMLGLGYLEYIRFQDEREAFLAMEDPVSDYDVTTSLRVHRNKNNIYVGLGLTTGVVALGATGAWLSTVF